MISKAAGEVIQEKDRAKQIKAITKQADSELKSMNKYFNKASKEIVEMTTRSDVTREEIYAYFEKVEKQREAFQEELIKLRFQARNMVDRQEWEAMYAKLK